MPARSAASPDDIEMASVAAALKSAAPKLLIVSITLGALTYAGLSMTAPRYQSQAELAIVAKGPSGAFADAKPAGGGETVSTKMDKEAINTHVRALQSPDLMATIADDLKLKDKPEFNSALGPVDTIGGWMRRIGLGGPRGGESERDRVMSVFREQIEVYTAKESRFIGIRFTSIDPALAADVANKLADAYRAALATQGVSEIDEQQKDFQGKIEKLTPEVAAAETEVDRYRGEINVFKGSGQGAGLNEQQMSEMTGELTRAKAARGEAEARAKGARDMMQAGSADALPDVQKSPLIQNLVQQRVRIERQISELSAALLPAHPRMRQLDAELAGLKRQLNGEIAKLVESLEKEAIDSAGREESIKKSLDDLKTRVVSNAPEVAKLRQFEANARAKRTELENLQNQLESNRKKLDMRAQPVEAQVISRAQPSSVPVFPKKVPLSALVAVAWLLFGTVWTITWALFNNARGGEAAAPATRVVVVPANVPRGEPTLAAPSKAAAASNAAPDPENSDESPNRRAPVSSIAALARRIEGNRTAEGGYRTMIVGDASGVDAAEEAVELVKALAASGAQVILVDCGRSGQGIRRSVGTASGPGLMELLNGDVHFEDVIVRFPSSGAHFIGRGGASLSPTLDPDQLNLILDALDDTYEHIVVAGPHGDARDLFEAIEGRFDAGVQVSEPKRRVAALDDAGDVFLGFEVAEIDVIRFERRTVLSSVSQDRMARATARNGVDARAG
ncbi:MAG: GumC family protein [Hyphomicrobium sp.]